MVRMRASHRKPILSSSSYGVLRRRGHPFSSLSLLTFNHTTDFSFASQNPFEPFYSVPTLHLSLPLLVKARKNDKQEELVQAESPFPKGVSLEIRAGQEAEEEEEVEISWLRGQVEDLVQLTNTAVKSVPGPRVGQSTLPWLLAVPLAYLGLTFVIAVYKTVKKYRSPRAQKKRQIGKNAFLVNTLDEYFPSKRHEFDIKALDSLENQCKFSSSEVLRKYIRYGLNERAFTPELVADFIHLRKVTRLTDDDVGEVLKEISRRIVKEKGYFVMDLRGFTEKGVKTKAALQGLVSKLLYLSELKEFSSPSASVGIKEIFGITDEDANTIRIETLSEVSDVESLEKMMDDMSDSESGDKKID